MFKKLLLPLVGLTLSAATQGFCGDAGPSTKAFEDGVKSFTANFSADLAKNTTGNVIFSGYNIMNALQLLYPGTTGAGQKEVATALGIANMPMDQFVSGTKAMVAEIAIPDSKRPGESKIKQSTSLWANSANGFKFAPQYLRTAKDIFGTLPTSLDFSKPATLATINGHVNTETDGMIPQLLSILDPQTTAILISTLYVEGEWPQEHRFAVSETKDLPFTNTSGKVSSMPIMSTVDNLEYAETANSQVVRMNTADYGLYLEVTLPKNTASAQARADFMSQPGVPTANFQMYKVTLQLPRFKVGFQQSVKNEVVDTMPDIFKIGGLNALGSPQSAVNDVIHSCVLEVQEYGFRAAAATAIIAVGAAAPPQYPEVAMNVNHSFGVRVVRNVNKYPDPNAEVELFRGWVEDPTPMAAPITPQ